MGVSGNNELISVVIPVYNGEMNIGRCLESVLNQSYKNIEILVVDDGSTDGTEDVVHGFMEREHRVHLISQGKNTQIFHARLAGMEAAKGDYLVGVDSDDEISGDYLEKLLYAAKTTDSDLVICDNLLAKKQGEVINDMFHSVPAGRKYMVPEEDVERQYYSYTADAAIVDQSYFVFWSKLYRRDLIEAALPWLKYINVPIIYSEDVLYAGVFLHLAKHTVFTHDGAYFYNDNPESVMRLNLMEKIGKICGDQLETICFLRWFLKQTGADPELMMLFENWRAAYWRFLESRYALYKLRIDVLGRK